MVNMPRAAAVLVVASHGNVADPKASRTTGIRKIKKMAVKGKTK